jgi:DNA-binding FadR family transcriptional regulator
MPIETPRSLYKQVADQLRQRIAAGSYAAGSTLPSEPELADQFGVSRVTINRAIQMLRAEGLVKVLRERAPRYAPSRLSGDRAAAGTPVLCARRLEPAAPSMPGCAGSG